MEIAIVIALLGVIAAAQILSLGKLNRINAQLEELTNQRERKTRDGIRGASNDQSDSCHD